MDGAKVCLGLFLNFLELFDDLSGHPQWPLVIVMLATLMRRYIL